MFELTLIWLGIALLLTPILAEYGKIRNKADRGFLWMGAGGAVYLLAAAFKLGIDGMTLSALGWGATLFSVIGLIITLIGAIFVLTGILK
ncbi:MAG: hypothetical protein KJ697_01255 [Nanoarchaeota archaeon]|nr:hypothetical protein [Nanoarchaeota archaeon]MBU4124277.1 hypothetical protein [Nanoarchaeota archaeon]